MNLIKQKLNQLSNYLREIINSLGWKNAFAFTILCWTIAFGHFLPWYEDILPDLYIVNRALAKKREVPEIKAENKVEKEYGPVSSVTTVIDVTPETIEEKIAKYFPEEPEIMTAIFKAESGLNPESQGWNCYYIENGERISRACEYEDRHKAWSVDCGIAQINHIGKTCPENLFDPEENLFEARKKYEKRGKQPWVAWLKDMHLKFLN